MTQGIGDVMANGVDNIKADAPPNMTTAAAAALGFVKMEDVGGIADVIKSASPSSASSSCAGNGSIVPTAALNAVYQSGFQPPPVWPNFYYHQLAAASHSSAAFGAAAASAAASCGWPSSVQSSDYYVSQCQNYGSNSKKTGRQTYTRHQTAILESRFSDNRYVTKKQREQLREDTKLNDRQIKIWFQNRRMKQKKEEQRREDHTEQTPLTANPPSKLTNMSSGSVSSSDISKGIIMPANHNHRQQHNQQQHQSRQQLQQSSLICEMSPESFHKNLVSLSLNELNQSADALIGTPIDTSTASVAATAAVANFAAGLAGGFIPTDPNSHNILNHHMHQQNIPHFNNLTGVMDGDKLKSGQAMAFSEPDSSNSQLMSASMWSSINNTANGAMITPSMSTTAMTSSSNGVCENSLSAPFGVGITAAMLSGGSTETPLWLSPQQFAQPIMPNGMMQSGNPGHHYSYNLYPANV